MDMDMSYTEGDVSLSPSQILDRLLKLRQLQLLQKGKLQKQQLDYHHSPEITSSITEIVSHFSNSTSYNTFRSLLQSSQEGASEQSQHLFINNTSKKDNLHNVIEGVSVLNLSEESECISDTPISLRSTTSAKVNSDQQHLPSTDVKNQLTNRQILLDDIPIQSPKKDFESLIVEKLSDENGSGKPTNNIKLTHKSSKPFLRRGEGIARFGLKKKDFVIQNTKSLPWRKKDSGIKPNPKPKTFTLEHDLKCKNDPKQIVQHNSKEISPLGKCNAPHLKLKLDFNKSCINVSEKLQHKKTISNSVEEAVNQKIQLVSESNSETNKNISNQKHPLQNNKERTWAAVFTKEQDDFLRQLKQSAYYKNFASPVKSTVSDISCNEQLINLEHDREKVDQNMFELIENKVSNDSFAMDSSFFNRFMGTKDISEFSGESTPLILKNCIYKNPNLMHIQPDIEQKNKINCSCTDAETCNSEDCTECGANCSTISSCCSCKSDTQNVSSLNHNVNTKKDPSKKVHQKVLKDNKEVQNCDNDIMTVENEGMNTNMAEMNAKLIATSELLKDRLKELEDEIETFRKENANLNKMREEVDLERQKFYEEKSAYEQKFNEEKVLSEYYLAEEKEKLSKQKQLYDRYVRDMRGRLNKKEKDEVANLRKEIYDLKEEIKLKDARSTSTIARLRNQIKLLDKDKKNLEDEVEKLKKENRRIQHSNEMTRRLTNIKYLEQINNKLSNMSSKNIQLNIRADSDVRYKTFEIERQSRSKKTEPVAKGIKKPRAKSVPNLNVTSRYAKYFSQKNSLSEREMNNHIADNNFHTNKYTSEHELSIDGSDINLHDSKGNRNNSEEENNLENSEEENNLEIIYNERFKSNSPSSKRSSTSISINSPDSSNGIIENSNDFFIRKSRSNAKLSSAKTSLSPSYEQLSQNFALNKSKEPTSSNRKSNNNQPLDFSTLKQDRYVNMNQRSKSPVSIITTSSQNSGTVINKDICSDTRMIPSPEPTLNKMSITKTNLNPIEIKKPDGSKELKFPNGNIKIISSDGKYSKFIYYNGDVKENFYNEGRIKYYYAETKTFHTTHPDGLEVLEFPDGHVEKRYKDGSSEIRLPNGSVRYYDPKNEHVREEWRFPDGTALTVSANGEQRIVFPNGQIEVHTKDHKRREFPDGTINLIYNDGTSETRYASGRVRIKDKHGNLIMDSAPG